MRILIIRHGDPDYAHDTLTAQGKIEAELLADYLKDFDIKSVYVSPLGRAQKTAEYYLNKTNKTAATLDWLTEFRGKCTRPNVDGITYAWDWLPQDWAENKIFYDIDNWYNDKAFVGTNTKSEFDLICAGLDNTLEKHGYKRNGMVYKPTKPNNDTIAFFCHFGVESVMLGHLIGVTPMVLWQGTVAAPTSITSVYTEERREGIASFRISCFGDTSHLAIGKEKPSFSARFCECYHNKEERHD